ncbi:50S ribosomal protein L11 methyltransferase [Spongiactinospora sp. TRM90649]|uniref:50S ribosomal protein L11 methyltransferase n=1 Tax=Spongiactinospora sp. TRM90649 TaxID=3031114 RepID=UPI0023F6DB90|nr:50S ribosomal protein L11 methyltransferase [Spongiactinospora sp. TRM90649]MDF5755249.1 50S ribosomal protein L11 methyltransferase [Spongiactinospora sp. TRM90649]
MAGLADFSFTTDLHLRLLLSLDRGHNLRRAIEKAVGRGAHVLDAGTGSGVLSFLALNAGAEQVVGVDRQHLDTARILAKHNGMDDRVRFIEADLMEPELPELTGGRPFDVLLAFIYTNHPLEDEARSRMVFSLRDRFCFDNSVIVPGFIRYSVTGCERTDWDMQTEFSDLRQSAKLLKECYDLDFQPLIDRTIQELAVKRSRPIDTASRDWRPPTRMGSVRFPRKDLRLLTEPTHYTEIDYSAPAFVGFPAETTLSMTVPGRLTGVLWTQELIFDGKPLWTTETYSPLRESLSVAADDSVVIHTDEAWRASNVLSAGRLPAAPKSR